MTFRMKICSRRGSRALHMYIEAATKCCCLCWIGGSGREKLKFATRFKGLRGAEASESLCELGLARSERLLASILESLSSTSTQAIFLLTAPTGSDLKTARSKDRTEDHCCSCPFVLHYDIEPQRRPCACAVSRHAFKKWKYLQH